MVPMGRPASRLIAEGRKPVIGLRFQTKISTREFLTSIEVHADVPRAGLDGWSRKRAFCCPVLWAPEDGDFASGRKDREPATAVREPFAVIVSPVAANVSRGTAPVAEIVSPKGPPFASLSIDDCEPLHLPGGFTVRPKVAYDYQFRNSDWDEGIIWGGLDLGIRF